ncbi:MAG: helix-turn-helix transcriptional regulator [Calothrix sp. MO_167.B12]|nr:helix-turn-helix transcriptional regulator [Calothrix sp. MO_167.B12]
MINGEKLFLSKHIDRINWEQRQVDKFRAIISTRGLSLRAIARKAGVAHSFVDKLRSRPCKPEMTTLVKVLDAVEIDVYQLFEAPTITISAGEATVM